MYQVFVQTHIPRALEEVEDHEKDFDRLAEGNNIEGIYYQTITGMRHDMSGAREGPAHAQQPLQVGSNPARRWNSFLHTLLSLPQHCETLKRPCVNS